MRSNLVSNAIKFTSRGSVAINARLLYSSASRSPGESDEIPSSAQTVQDHLAQHQSGQNQFWDHAGDVEKNLETAPPQPPAQRCAIIRLEVQDSGVGLRNVDVMGWVRFALSLSD